MTNLEKYTRFITCMTAGIPIPFDLVAWQLEAYDRHQTEGTPLCICLGIRGAGIRSAKNRELIKRRDMLMKWAAECCTAYPDESLWSKCKTLNKLFKRWPRSKNENPILQHIYDLGCNIPTSTHGIYERIAPLDIIRYSPSKNRK